MKLAFKDVAKEYAAAHGKILLALDGISFSSDAREFVCLLGPSGCGKSTLLKMAAGLEQPTSGSVVLDGTAVVSPRRGCGMVFQDYALFPWLSVQKNVAFGLELQGIPDEQTRKLVTRYIQLVGLKGFEHSLPSQLSGGMKQRVALARALVLSPELLMMDEPFGALDSFTRMEIQQELVRLWQERPFSVLFVTHDIEEAVYLADRIIVMTARPGRIKTIVPVPLRRPRTRTDEQFVQIRNYLFKQYEHAAFGSEVIPVEAGVAT